MFALLLIVTRSSLHSTYRYTSAGCKIRSESSVEDIKFEKVASDDLVVFGHDDTHIAQAGQEV
jgi:hypothetical protein